MEYMDKVELEDEKGCMGGEVSREEEIVCPECGLIHDDCLWERISISSGDTSDFNCDGCHHKFEVTVDYTHTFTSCSKDSE